MGTDETYDEICNMQANRIILSMHESDGTIISLNLVPSRQRA